MTFHLGYNENEILYLTMTKEFDYKNFSKIADLTVDRVKLPIAESPKSCETKSINRYQEKNVIDTHFKIRLCVENSV